jgi:hypothetical protein
MSRTEVRFEIDSDELSVLDGYCAGTGKHRTEVFRELLRDWSDKKLHESIMVCRVAQVNPTDTETGRSTEENK